MFSSRRKFQAGLLSLLPAALLFSTSCGVEEEATEDPAVVEAIAQLQESEAGSALAAALAEARNTDRLVFLHTGADW